ncbi:MAG TPA: polysaccharide biosynthesis tyrosine autokinase, partial [Pseudonocardia sp.]
MSVNEALRVLRTRWRVAALCLLLALLGASVVTAALPRQYTSDVTLIVQLQGEAADSDAANQANELAKDRLVSYTSLMTDARVTQPVVDRLQLGIPPAQLAKQVAVTTQPDTNVLTAVVTDTSPDRAAAIANALAEELTNLVGQLEQPIGTRVTVPGQPVPPPSKIGAQILRPAVPNPVPVSPNVLFNLALGGAVGLLLGIGAAFLRNARDTSVRSVRRVEALTGAPVLASVAADRDARRHPVTLGAHPGSAQVEAYRKLRTNLLFTDPGKPHRVIVVSSASVGEGKSTTACNLALALADAGNRVVLIDVNLRRPQVEQYLGIGPTAGVVNVLAGRIPLRRAVGRWVEGGMDVLTAGPVPFNPSELLASRATAALLDEVRQHYDFVILDTPALLPVTDAATVAARADGVVLVVRYGRTVEEQVSGAMNALDAVQAPLLGTVLIGTPPTRLRLRSKGGAYPEPDRTLLPPRNAGPPANRPAGGPTPEGARPATRPAGSGGSGQGGSTDQPTEILVLPKTAA